MIAHLRGKLLAKQPHVSVIDVQGVGYEVTIPVSTYSSLPQEGEDVAIRIYTQVREDAIALFGFATSDEKTLFEKLISVSGIGPKLAITVLSGVAVPELISAIRAQQSDRLTKIPGVGKKTAERMVLELKDKLDGVGAAAVAAPAASPVLFSALEMDVLSALVNLGCQRPAAEAAVRKAASTGTPAEFDLLFRRALELAR
ncbi:MAG TPA: Holliday junction branch migration protein RuvA [Bryobacteraceae bacterium]|nr:Holliday junction branch migration protein RuvA [Bryobacteraceae bacterium]